MRFLSKSAQETINFAARFAKRLKAGDTIGLFGNLGSGKTTFTKGLAKGLGVEDARYVNSPTFVLIKEYEGRIPLYHFDLYRLDSLKDIEDLGFDDYLSSDGVMVIEWADKAEGLLPKGYFRVELITKKQDQRLIKVKKGPINVYLKP